MKIASCVYRGEQHIAVIDGDKARIPGPDSSPSVFRDCLGLIQDTGQPSLNALSVPDSTVTEVDLEAIELLAPIPRPAKNIMCLGLNYSEHVMETAAKGQREAKLPEHPIVFTKNVTSVIGHREPIPYNPEVSAQLDWEVELGVIIGKPARHVTPEDAMDCVFGYTVINDISARDLQFRHKQFFIGKSLDGGCPMGPWIVTADEITDPHKLRLSCAVNGVVKQDSSTRNMIFDIPAIISTLSRGMTLEPGDIIATGTPDGVGFARTPPEFLNPGDVVTCEIEGIGTLENPVVSV